MGDLIPLLTRLREAEAQRNLADRRLEKTVLRAPFAAAVPLAIGRGYRAAGGGRNGYGAVQRDDATGGSRGTGAGGEGPSPAAGSRVS